MRVRETRCPCVREASHSFRRLLESASFNPGTAEETIPSASFDQVRHRATVRLVKWLRHQLATPLSGAALHLEVASQRLLAGEGCDPGRAVENLKMCQAEVEGASRLLDVLTEVARCGEETPGSFSLPDVVIEGAMPWSANPRGIRVDLPVRSAAPALFGVRRSLESTVAELTRRAVGQATDGGTVRWTVEEAPGEKRLVLSWPARPDANSPKGLVDDGIARWAVESHGGAVSAKYENGRYLVAAAFSAGPG